MELEQSHPHPEVPPPAETLPETDRRAASAARRWLEDAWRHGEVVVDHDGIQVDMPPQPSSRFDVAVTDATTDLM